MSAAIDWMDGERRFPGEYRFPKLAAIAMIESRVETKAGARTERRFYITSRAMTAKGFGEAVRAHWRIENALHWVLDVTFKDDLSRVRKETRPRKHGRGPSLRRQSPPRRTR